MTALATRQANTTLWDVIQRRPFDAGIVQRICHEMLPGLAEQYCKPARDDERSVASAPAGASFTIRTSENNCYGDPPTCVFRGRKDSAAECEAVCAADAACRSFTWVGATGDSFAHECRTRNDTVWQLIPEGTHTSGYKGTPPTPAPFRCVNASSCNNAGECDAATGACKCDITWTGATCSILALQPAQSVGNGDSGYVLGSGGRVNTWGGSILAEKGGAAGHDMFAAAFPNGTLTDWETKSIVIHLTSTEGIEGPYKFSDTVATPRRDADPPLWDSLDCHNPTVHRLGDELVVFYIGVGVNATSPAAVRRPELDKAQTIGAAYASGPDGPWTRLKEPLLVATEPWECGGGPDCGVSNPALLVRPDGKLNMFYRGNQDRGVGVATAEHWRGPWVKSAESITSNGIFRGNSVIGLEDLYVWPNPQSTRRPGCHMVLHQEEAGNENLGAHAFTEDATCVSGWQLTLPRPSHAYGPEVRWTNGSTTKFASRERPQVVLDPATGWPTHLSNGVITTGWSGRSYTIVVPIAHPA